MLMCTGCETCLVSLDCEIVNKFLQDYCFRKWPRFLTLTRFLLLFVFLKDTWDWIILIDILNELLSNRLVKFSKTSINLIMQWDLSNLALEKGFIFSIEKLFWFLEYTFQTWRNSKWQSFSKLRKTVILKTLINMSSAKNNWRKCNVRKDVLHDLNDVQWYIDNTCTYIMS